jgi:hypothetical protein
MNKASGMNDDDIIQQRIRGRSGRAIAPGAGVSVAQVNDAIDRRAATAIDDETRKNTLVSNSMARRIATTFLRTSARRRCACSALVTKIMNDAV